MWGHSGGGFITADAMFRFPGHPPPICRQPTPFLPPTNSILLTPDAIVTVAQRCFAARVFQGRHLGEWKVSSRSLSFSTLLHGAVIATVRLLAAR